MDFVLKIFFPKLPALLTQASTFDCMQTLNRLKSYKSINSKQKQIDKL
jgi:hypothetical protein